MNTPPIDAAEAKEQLALRCTLDRLQIKILVKDVTRQPDNPLAHAFSLAEDALAVSIFVPGGIGRWAGRLRTIARAVKPWCR